MKKILIMFLIAIGFTFTGCAPEITSNETKEKVSSPFNKFETPRELDVNRGIYGNELVSCKVYQTLSEKEGLAEMAGYDAVYVVNDSPIFDGMVIKETESNRFKVAGTFKFCSNDNRERVVPVIKLFKVEYY